MCCVSRQWRAFVRDTRGQALVVGLFAIFLLTLVAAAVSDVYAVLQARNWAYNVVNDAALTAVTRGRDWAQSADLGRPVLDALRADAEARSVVATEAARQQRTVAYLDVRVRPTGFEPATSGFPSRAVADQRRQQIWSTDGPAVGVELHVYQPVFLLGIWPGLATEVDGKSVVRVAAFGAAGLCGGDILCQPDAAPASTPTPSPVPSPTPTPSGPTPTPIPQVCPPAIPYFDALTGLSPTQLPPCWSVVSGSWGGSEAAGFAGIFEGVGAGEAARAMLAQDRWNQYTARIDVRVAQLAQSCVSNPPQGVGLWVRVGSDSPTNGYRIALRCDGLRVENALDGETLASRFDVQLDASGAWQTIAVTVRGDRLCARVDDGPTVAVSDARWTSGGLVLEATPGLRAQWRNVSVGPPEADCS